jgi:gamma-tubulin complex component 4
MIYGRIEDPYHEFPIVHHSNMSRSTDSLVTISNGSLPPHQEVVHHHHHPISLASGHMTVDHRLESNSVEAAQMTSRYSLDLQKIPSYIPIQTMEYVLFIGRVSWALRMTSTSNDEKQPFESRLEIVETTLREAMSSLMQTDHFHIVHFEQAIAQANDSIARMVWSWIIHEAGFIDHLHHMRQIYFLGYGPIGRELIEAFQSLPINSSTKINKKHVKGIFRKILVKLLPENHELIRRLSLKFIEASTAILEDETTCHQIHAHGWESSLYLDYTFDWPLDLLFSTRLIEKYNHIFRFLLAVHRVQLTLRQTWQYQQQANRFFIAQRDTIWVEIWHLRHHMTLFMDLFQMYLQSEVVNTNYQHLIEVIGNTRDFEHLSVTLEDHLNTIMSQCFLHIRSIRQTLYDLFDVILTFCTYIEQFAVWSRNVFPDRIEFLRFRDGFHRYISLLFHTFSNVQANLNNPHLAPFLLRLDFNYHYSKSLVV